MLNIVVYFVGMIYLIEKAELPSLNYKEVVPWISCGFPSPALDFIDLKIDVTEYISANKGSVFYGRAVGDSMVGAGIADGDLLVIDRSRHPEHESVAICYLDNEFTAKRVIIKHNRIWLHPENPAFDDIEVRPGSELVIWGIITYVIKKIV